MKALIWFGLSLIVSSSWPLAQASERSPCDQQPTRAGWHVFVDYKDRFCFEYPPKYHVAPAVFAPGVSSGGAHRFIARLTTKPSPAEGASAADPMTATINIYAYGMPFRPTKLNFFAPTGLQDIPPQRIQAAHGEFYYYGPGGGGVDYPDDFFFGVRGRTFSIEFTGPYSRDKTPDAVTKEVEPEVLESFRSF